MSPLPAQLVYRDWSPDDAIPPITGLLHAAYGFLARMGFNYTATYQDDATTLRRLQSGSSIVAVANGAIVGTVTLYAPKPESSCAWYTHAHYFGQFGVHPDFQKLGIGRELMRRIEQRAREASATELALDTSEGADHLCRWYQSLGYRFVQHIAWEGKTYRSVILSKTLAASPP